MSKYSTIVSIIYAVIYGLVFVGTSIYSFIETKTKMIKSKLANDKNKEKESTTKHDDINKQIEINIIKRVQIESFNANTQETNDKYDTKETKETDVKYEEKDEKVHESRNEATTSSTKITQSDKSDTNSFECDIKFMKAWCKSIWRKKKIYWSILPHILDQATDIGVLLTYYNEWINYENNENNNNINEVVNPLWLFWLSLFIIIMQKIVSSVTMYVLTQSKENAILQFFDFLLIKAVYINYLCGLDEPGNPQRYIELLEAVFESGPQILLSMGYILKKAGVGEDIEAIIIVSIVFSLWSLTSKVTSDDKVIFDEDWDKSKPYRNLDISFAKKLCFVRFNYEYLIRVILWRFFEIASRICLLVLIWINIGGLAVTLILGIEFFICLAFCFVEKTPDLMGNLMFISFASTKGYIRWFYWYRIISFYLFMIMVTVFSSIDFKTSKVPEYEERHQITIHNTFGFFILCFTWIAAFISHLVLLVLVVTDIIDGDNFDLTETLDIGYNNSSTSRSIFSYVANGQFKEVKQLILFGVKVKDNFVDSNGLTILHYACIYIKDDMDLFNVLATANQQHIHTKEEDGRTPLHVAAYYDNIDAVKWLVDHNANLNEKNNYKQTPMIYAADYNKSKSVEIVKYLLRNGAETHHKDKYGKSVLDICKEKDATKYKEIILMLENNI